MAKETPFDRARDFVEEKIDKTKDGLGDSYAKAHEQFDDVSEDVRKTLNEVIEMTAGNTGLVVRLALNYGGKPEILDAVRRIAEAVRSGDVRPVFEACAY